MSYLVPWLLGKAITAFVSFNTEATNPFVAVNIYVLCNFKLI